jgi:hypothetical protein
MSRIVMGVSVAVVVVLLGLFLVGTVFAQSPTATPAPTTPWGQAWGGIWRGSSTISKAITDLLGMTQGQILDERLAGKTLLDIAKEKGVTEQQLIDALVSGRKEVLDQAVKDGRLTQAQADWMLEAMKTMAPLQLTNPFGPGANNGPRGGRFGGMGGGRFGGMRGGRFGGMGGGPFGGMRGGPGGNWGPWNNAPSATPTPSGTSS